MDYKFKNEDPVWVQVGGSDYRRAVVRKPWTTPELASRSSDPHYSITVYTSDGGTFVATIPESRLTPRQVKYRVVDLDGEYDSEFWPVLDGDPKAWLSSANQRLADGRTRFTAEEINDE